MLTKNGINERLVKIYTISVPIGGDKLEFMKECEQDALNSGGTIISVVEENNMVIIKAEMPMK